MTEEETETEYNPNTNVDHWGPQDYNWGDKPTNKFLLPIEHRTMGCSCCGGEYVHKTKAEKLKFLKDYIAELEKMRNEVLRAIVSLNHTSEGDQLEYCDSRDCMNTFPLGHECPEEEDED